MSGDPIMEAISAAHALLKAGDRSGARRGYEAIWSRVESSAEPMHEVALSHYMADVQDDPADELAWDLRALNAAMRCGDGDVQRHSTVKSTITSFMPSLHVNLGVDYFKLGDFERSKEHLALARQFVSELADDAYGQNIRGWIERLAADIYAIDSSETAA